MFIGSTSVFQSTHPSGVRRFLIGSVTTPVGISIHAPQWGATWPRLWRAVGLHFNPRTPVGCDNNPRKDVGDVTISIHAPQWGATCSCRRCPSSPTYFNPRTPVGCDIPGSILGHIYERFQSTHPSGVRPCRIKGEASSFLISIHAPQWGATQGRVELLTAAEFQSTHPSGVRRWHGIFFFP